VPLSYRVEDNMRLSKDKTALGVNPSLTLAGIPPETSQYRLGNYSALAWVIDQYRVSEDKRSGIRSAPNRLDEQYIIVHHPPRRPGGTRQFGDGKNRCGPTRAVC
jgi:predicted helicase